MLLDLPGSFFLTAYASLPIDIHCNTEPVLLVSDLSSCEERQARRVYERCACSVRAACPGLAHPCPLSDAYHSRTVLQLWEEMNDTFLLTTAVLNPFTGVTDQIS